MNRQARRNMKKGTSAGELKYLSSPCTLTEAAQIARGVAEDVLEDFQKHTSPLQVSMSLQIELLKTILFEANLISPDAFHEMYLEQAEKFQEMQRQHLAALSEDEESSDGDLKMSSAPVGDIEIVKE